MSIPTEPIEIIEVTSIETGKKISINKSRFNPELHSLKAKAKRAKKVEAEEAPVEEVVAPGPEPQSDAEEEAKE